MRVIEIGNLRDAHNGDSQLPERGIVIEGTLEELKALPPVLYREVNLEVGKPKCEKRGNADEHGLEPCNAIGCEVVGDMPCNCETCPHIGMDKCSKAKGVRK